MRYCHEACYTAPSGRVIDLPPPIGQMMENAFIVRSSTPVEAPPVCGKTRFAVWKEDTADAGRRLLDAGLSPAILNLADELTPGGGVRKGSQAQEESLCRRSTLLVSLSQFHPEYAQADGIPFVEQGYPIEREEGLIYSGGVRFFRDVEAKNYALLEKPCDLDVISCPALRNPRLIAPNTLSPADAETTMSKIRSILRIALFKRNNSLVLGAFGCGAFKNPPEHIARLFRQVFDEEEFSRSFEVVVFAILEGRKTTPAPHAPEGNFLPFQRVFGS